MATQNICRTRALVSAKGAEIVATTSRRNEIGKFIAVGIGGAKHHQQREQIEMSDYELHIRVKNGLMLRLMRERGIKTIAELSRKSGISLASLHDAANLKRSLLVKDKTRSHQIRNCYSAIAEYFGVLPEEIVPREMWESELKENFTRVELTSSQARMVSGTRPFDIPALEHQIDTNRVVENLQKALTEKEQRVIDMRFAGEYTLEEVAVEFNVTRERIRQIEGKALRKMRVKANRQSLDSDTF